MFYKGRNRERKEEAEALFQSRREQIEESHADKEEEDKS